MMDKSSRYGNKTLLVPPSAWREHSDLLQPNHTIKQKKNPTKYHKYFSNPDAISICTYKNKSIDGQHLDRSEQNMYDRF